VSKKTAKVLDTAHSQQQDQCRKQAVAQKRTTNKAKNAKTISIPQQMARLNGEFDDNTDLDSEEDL
jgi:hypothetical protein